MRSNPTELTTPQILFENRTDAGRKLSSELVSYANPNTLVLAIPNGGVPIAMEVAKALNTELDVIVVRKLVLPMVLEGGLGAVADDGTLHINEDLIRKYGLSREQIEYEADNVKTNVKQRSLKYNFGVPRAALTGKIAIIIDDGLASGVTMAVAVEAVRHRRPRQIVVAVPVASVTGYNRAAKLADKVVSYTIAKMPKFFLADFYRHWGDIDDDATVHSLQQWRSRHSFG